jgi:NADPH2:quinone reductase
MNLRHKILVCSAIAIFDNNNLREHNVTDNSISAPISRQYVHINDDKSLSILEQPIPQLQADEVLIKVCGAGVNRGDLMQRQGLYPPPADASPVMGLEVSGIVIAVGAAVNDRSIGDRICALTHGAGYCEYTTVPASQCIAVPDSVSLLDAAALPEALFTVWHNVFQRCNLTAGETVLIHGGSSGIGTMAIQMAKVIGATIYATAGTDEKCALCEALGASKTVNYKTGDFETELPPVNVILDMAGGDFFQKNINLLAPDGRVSTIAMVRGFQADINFLPMMVKRLIITGSTMRPQSFANKAQMALEISEHIMPAIVSGEIKPVIDSIYALSDVEKAHERMGSGEHAGKVILAVDESMA